MTTLTALKEHRWPSPPTARQLAAVSTALISRTWTGGPATLAAEDALRDVTGAPHAVAFNSCTSAIHATLIAHGAGLGTALHTPAFGFAGTLTGAAHLGARLLYHDVDPGTGNSQDPHPTPGQLVLTPDLHGLPHTLTHDALITDACQSLGTLRNGRHIHHSGTACWSFSATKLVSAPDGGAVTTDNEALADELRQLRDYGAEPGPARANAPITRHGHNWRPSELSMALVTEQLHRLPETAARAHETAETVRAALDGTGLWTQKPPDGVQAAWHKIRVGFPDPPGVRRAQRLRDAFQAAGIPTHRWGARPLPQHPQFAAHRDTTHDVTTALAAGTFCLGTEACPPWTWTPREARLLTQHIEMIMESL